MIIDDHLSSTGEGGLRPIRQSQLSHTSAPWLARIRTQGQKRRLTPVFVLLLTTATLATGCVPSLSYRLGQGFYSDEFSKQQVQAAANVGQVQNLGRFEVQKGACFNFSQDQADHNIIFPAIQEALQQREGNVADQITANEQWYDVPMGMLIVPGLIGCSNWTVSGDVLRIKPISAENGTGNGVTKESSAEPSQKPSGEEKQDGSDPLGDKARVARTANRAPPIISAEHP